MKLWQTRSPSKHGRWSWWLQQWDKVNWRMMWHVWQQVWDQLKEHVTGFRNRCYTQQHADEEEEHVSYSSSHIVCELRSQTSVLVCITQKHSSCPQWYKPLVASLEPVVCLAEDSVEWCSEKWLPHLQQLLATHVCSSCIHLEPGVREVIAGFKGEATRGDGWGPQSSLNRLYKYYL